MTLSVLYAAALRSISSRCLAPDRAVSSGHLPSVRIIGSPANLLCHRVSQISFWQKLRLITCWYRESRWVVVGLDVKEDEKGSCRGGESRVTMEKVSRTERMVMWRILNCTMIMNSVVRMIQLIPPTNRCRDLWDASVFHSQTSDFCWSLRRNKSSYSTEKKTDI